MTCETTSVFDFERKETQHLFKFSLRGENFEDIRKKAKVLQNEIFIKVYGGEATTINPIKFEFDDEVLTTD